jgi:PEP-CTERM/exosortase A-associated glycosyltransferase
VHILHVLDHSLPFQSGYVFRTLGILQAQRQLGWITTQLTTPRYNVRAEGEETVDGWTFHRTPRPSGPFSSTPILRELLEMRATGKRLEDVIRRVKPDVVHAHSPLLTGIPALRAARKAGIPMVYEVRALWEDAAVDLGNATPAGFRYRTTRALETRLMRRADAVVTLCQSMREELISRGVSAGKITIIPNAVDPASFSERRQREESLLRTLGLGDRVVLGFIGSFYHYEGLDLLIRALPEISAVVPDITLLLVGGGPEEERLRDLSTKLNLDPLVRFTGRVPHEQVQRYYDLIDFFIYPRRSMRLTELVTPLKPLEAMASRRIVIASSVGGHRELIRDEVTGYLFRPDDSSALARRVLEVMKNSGAHAQMREVARRFIETERTWTISAARYQQVYHAEKTGSR